MSVCPSAFRTTRICHHIPNGLRSDISHKFPRESRHTSLYSVLFNVYLRTATLAGISPDIHVCHAQGQNKMDILCWSERKLFLATSVQQVLTFYVHYTRIHTPCVVWEISTPCNLYLVLEGQSRFWQSNSVPKMNTLYSVSRLGRTNKILTVSVPKMNTLYKPLHTSSRCNSNSSDYRHVTLLTDYTQGLAKLKFLASYAAYCNIDVSLPKAMFKPFIISHWWTKEETQRQ
jgi:hypothetical protein